MPPAFPHLTDAEFEQGCDDLVRRFHQRRSMQKEWLSVEKMHRNGSVVLTITKHLTRDTDAATTGKDAVEEDDVAEDDEGALHEPRGPVAIIQYDVIRSPIYQVPVLYFGIHDPEHRYPPTMTTLYEHLVSPHFRPQAQNAGVIGGITIANHPVTDRPQFFIHPCQTAQVMEASVPSQTTAEQYLIAWIGAVGKSVGLNLPLALAK
ncbi:uncharacterized protein SETTUDRAFT_60514, partial [Exserohilum turcica Et28A]